MLADTRQSPALRLLKAHWRELNEACRREEEAGIHQGPACQAFMEDVEAWAKAAEMSGEPIIPRLAIKGPGCHPYPLNPKAKGKP
jgi:hypothetical protein